MSPSRRFVLKTLILSVFNAADHAKSVGVGLFDCLSVKGIRFQEAAERAPGCLILPKGAIV